MNQGIKLSVIIPTRNRHNYLRDVLASIEKQTLDRNLFEVLVIDNGSTDNTPNVVEEFKDKLPNLVYVYEDKAGLHEGRHAGYRTAKSDILVYADDDIIAFPTWLEGVLESFNDEEVVLVGGKNLPDYEDNPPFWILEKWYQLCPYGHCVPQLSIIDFGDEVLEVNPGYVYGCNFSIRRWVVERAGGFLPDGMPWDKVEYRGTGETYISSFISRNCLRVVYNPKASVWHRVPKSRLTVDYFKKWHFSIGIGMSYTDLRSQQVEILSAANIPIKKRIRHKLRTLLGDKLTKVLVSLKFKKKVDWSKYPDLERQFIQSQEIGYSYHQNLYQKSAELREWVHRKTYL